MTKYLIRTHDIYYGVWANEPDWEDCVPLEIFTTKDQATKWIEKQLTEDK